VRGESLKNTDVLVAQPNRLCYKRAACVSPILKTFNFLYEEKNENLFNTKSIVGRVLILSLLVGGLVCAGTFAVNTFVPTPTEAANCCGSAEQGTNLDRTYSEMESCCGNNDGPLTTSSKCSCVSNSSCPCSSSGNCGTKSGCSTGCSLSLCGNCDGTICNKSTPVETIVDKNF